MTGSNEEYDGYHSVPPPSNTPDSGLPPEQASFTASLQAQGACDLEGNNITMPDATALPAQEPSASHWEAVGNGGGEGWDAGLNNPVSSSHQEMVGVKEEEEEEGQGWGFVSEGGSGAGPGPGASMNFDNGNGGEDDVGREEGGGMEGIQFLSGLVGMGGMDGAAAAAAVGHMGGMMMREEQRVKIEAEQEMGGVGVEEEEEEEGQSRRKRRNRWGPIESEVPQIEVGKKKRRSRWETADDSGALAIIPKFPKELTLPGGIRVCGICKLQRSPSMDRAASAFCS